MRAKTKVPIMWLNIVRRSFSNWARCRGFISGAPCPSRNRRVTFLTRATSLQVRNNWKGSNISVVSRVNEIDTSDSVSILIVPIAFNMTTLCNMNCETCRLRMRPALVKVWFRIDLIVPSRSRIMRRWMLLICAESMTTNRSASSTVSRSLVSSNRGKAQVISLSAANPTALANEAAAALKKVMSHMPPMEGHRRFPYCPQWPLGLRQKNSAVRATGALRQSQSSWARLWMRCSGHIHVPPILRYVALQAASTPTLAAARQLETSTALGNGRIRSSTQIL
mmetsp:Transcript_33449/g.94009  ORF Transcript_33449/g.94009 Transcript_33449/m.94009 type:complete len:280 (+) Transcript_33449:605-1444(+)